jgi:hypothetical protein
MKAIAVKLFDFLAFIIRRCFVKKSGVAQATLR